MAAQAYVGKSIGARRLTWFPLIIDPETGKATYGPPIRLSRLITITVTPVISEGLLESDDGTEDEASFLEAYDITINASQLTDSIRAGVMGHRLDETGGILYKSTDVSQEGALAWEELISSKQGGESKYKKVILYKGTFKEFAETANTKVRGGITYQTHNLTGRFYARNNGAIRYDMRPDTPGYSEAKAAEWFNVPQEAGSSMGAAVETPTALPAAGAVAAGTDVKLSTTTEGASIRYTLDGTEPDAGSIQYDGPITVSEAMTIKAVAFKSGMKVSGVLTAAYTIE